LSSVFFSDLSGGVSSSDADALTFYGLARTQPTCGMIDFSRYCIIFFLLKMAFTTSQNSRRSTSVSWESVCQTRKKENKRETEVSVCLRGEEEWTSDVERVSLAAWGTYGQQGLSCRTPPRWPSFYNNLHL